MKSVVVFALLTVFAGAFWFTTASAGKDIKETAGQMRLYSVKTGDYFLGEKVNHSESEWEKLLTEEQYHVLREQGTERAFTGQYWNKKEHGVYRCAGCGLDLYLSDHKYKSGTGWPSFYRAVADENVSIRPDNSFFMQRNELICSRCGGHLGHVFDDGPAPTGKRHCINSVSLVFHPLGKE